MCVCVCVCVRERERERETSWLFQAVVQSDEVSSLLPKDENLPQTLFELSIPLTDPKKQINSDKNILVKNKIDSTLQLSNMLCF